MYAVLEHPKSSRIEKIESAKVIAACAGVILCDTNESLPPWFKCDLTYSPCSNSSQVQNIEGVQPDPLTTFGAAVRARRLKLSLTQERLAELTGLDPTYISGIERGRRNPSLKNIVKIARALKTSVAKLAAKF
jgi:DNA-binding XRE family transcriptional regulator